MLPANRAFDSNGFPEAGATVKLYQSGTTTPANFYADNALTISLGSTLVANAAGRLVTVAYQDTSTPFRLKVFDANGDELDDIDPYYFGLNTVANLPNGATVVNRTALASITNVTNGQSAILSESGREGTFVFSTDDLSAEVAADPLQGIYVPPSSDTTGASGAWVRKFDGAVQVNWFGAKGDGATDDRAAIQAAINHVSSAGGGTVLFPAGTHLVGKNPASTYALSVPSNVALEGDGPSSVIKLKAAADAHVVALTSVSDVQIRNLTIDGNRANQTGGSNCHGARLESVTRCLIQNVTVKNAYFYGIGMEGGTLTDITVDCVNVLDIGSDGIDLKNLNDDNSNLKFSNITVRNWAIMGTGDVAIDCRGPCQLSNIVAIAPGSNDAMGIRFRQGELLDVNGLGAHDSTLTNFYVDMGSATNGTGVYVAARNVSIAGGRIKGGFRGLYMLDSGSRASTISVSGCSEAGVSLIAGGSGLDADEVILVNIRSESCGGNGFTIETDDCSLVACQAESNTGKGLNITATASRTQVLGGVYGTSNVGGQIADAGVKTTIRYVDGVADKIAGTAQSGTYTPSATLVTNVTAATPAACQWSRTGNVVTVSGQIDIQPTASGTVQIALQLPVASVFTASSNAGGTAFSTSAGYSLECLADVARGRVAMRGTATISALRTFSFSFTYQVLP
jgi:hypothetical protein